MTMTLDTDKKTAKIKTSTDNVNPTRKCFLITISTINVHFTYDNLVGCLFLGKTDLDLVSPLLIIFDKVDGKII